jgi:hypothetical protein
MPIHAKEETLGFRIVVPVVDVKTTTTMVGRYRLMPKPKQYRGPKSAQNMLPEKPTKNRVFEPTTPNWIRW